MKIKLISAVSSGFRGTEPGLCFKTMTDNQVL